MIYDVSNFDEDLKDFYLRVGKNVKNARISKNLTQEELAHLLNFKATSSISNREIFYKNSHFSLSHLYKISLVLDIELSSLIK
ncbi:helix-turn-helix domain-containing protein [Aliarcobacter butzleri]|uniref:helix-turn-helix domain-containing protein n=1 Tax=Aliarcobacter butzleri TaxID=28197 RepID=UPI0012699F30|nr:helix-turn-helix transcriptional regulator [Aliarcobacter butzleri]